MNLLLLVSCNKRLLVHIEPNARFSISDIFIIPAHQKVSSNIFSFLNILNGPHDLLI